MRTVTSLANRGVICTLFDGFAVNAQPILFRRLGGRSAGARQMADTAVYLSDFLMRVGDYVEVAAGAGAHTVDRFRISRLIYVPAEKPSLPMARKAVRCFSRG
jgi:hypothetical protein